MFRAFMHRASWRGRRLPVVSYVRLHKGRFSGEGGVYYKTGYKLYRARKPSGFFPAAFPASFLGAFCACFRRWPSPAEMMRAPEIIAAQVRRAASPEIPRENALKGCSFAGGAGAPSAARQSRGHIGSVFLNRGGKASGGLRYTVTQQLRLSGKAETVRAAGFSARVASAGSGQRCESGGRGH